ncbi:hypothetical protein AB205_0026770 [Aquarana catesbeiana]|uniref:Uncharacterized protein n=1 Tax=Aquarana catesbeiana TaxID=8400 RepID=A0A2G9SCW2_AQUCT|nr:hypothetical protein AB205_0026770 [Aquarana catesbeiana]
MHLGCWTGLKAYLNLKTNSVMQLTSPGCIGFYILGCFFSLFSPGSPASNTLPVLEWLHSLLHCIYERAMYPL